MVTRRTFIASMESPMETENASDEGRSAEKETGLDESKTGIDKIRERINREKIVNDAIFGFITLKPYIVTIIDTVVFQRLRCIWHLGVTPFVYPTANHTRFEHAIASYHLASRLVRKLKEQLDEEINEITIITEEDVKCVEIAALCHDIGRGPFSDVWEDLILPHLSIKHNYKKHFPYIWNELKKYDKIKEMLREGKLGDQEEKLIDSIINGIEVPGKEILCNIVCNIISGLDVDKWDCLARDSSNLGHVTTNYKVDIDRMIHFARAVKDIKLNKWKIAFRKTESLNIVRVFQLTHSLHQTAYKHRTVIAIEMMMLDGFIRYFATNPISIETSEWVLQNSDSIFWSNVGTIDEFKRILIRDLYRPIYEAVVYKSHDDYSSKIKDYLIEKGHLLMNIRIRFCSFKLGNTKKNPMLSIPFYKKDNLYKYEEYTESTIPLRFTVYESKIIVFSILPKEEPGPNEDNIKSDLDKYFEKSNEEDAAEESDKWIYHSFNA